MAEKKTSTRAGGKSTRKATSSSRKTAAPRKATSSRKATRSRRKTTSGSSSAGFSTIRREGQDTHLGGEDRSLGATSRALAEAMAEVQRTGTPMRLAVLLEPDGRAQSRAGEEAQDTTHVAPDATQVSR